MVAISEFQDIWRQLTTHFPVKEGLDAGKVGQEYFRFLSDVSDGTLRGAVIAIIRTRKIRSLPSVAEIREGAAALAKESASPSDDFSERIAARWKEADRILALMFAAREDWQIREAIDLGFSQAFRITARRVIFERLRDNLDVQVFPLLSYGPAKDGRPMGMFDYLREKHLCEQEAATWQAEHLRVHGRYRAVAVR